MTRRVEFAGPDDRIDAVLRRLIDDIRGSRGLERITVVTPTHQASFYLRRALARQGLFNVDFKRLEDIAEQLAGGEFTTPLLHDLQASEFVFEAARDASSGARLGGADVSPQLQSALHSTFRDLELLDRPQLDALAMLGPIQQELVARFDRYMEFASDYRRGELVASRAAELVKAGHDRTVSLGTIVLLEVAPVAPVQRSLFEALAELDQAVTIVIIDDLIDSEKTEAPGSVRGENAPTASLTEQPPSNTNLRPISVPDVAEEVRSVVRQIVELARSGQKFAQMAVVFEDESYASRIAEALELAGVPVSGPDRTALSDTPEGRFISGLLDVFDNGFTRLDLTAWLATAPVKDPKTDMAVPASRWDVVSRGAGVTHSVENSWTPRLTQFAKSVVARANHSRRLEEGRANEVEAAESDATYARALLDFVTTLDERKPGVDQDSWAGFAGWLRSLIADYLFKNEADDPDDFRSSAGRLTSLIERLESLETPGEAPGYEHCVGVLREQLTRRSAGLRSLGSGVYVGPVWTAAGCPFESVLLVGMVEGRYPSAGATDPLLPDVLKRNIDAGGRYLATAEQIAVNNRHTFNSVVSSARNIYMYWPSGIPGEAREFGPARWFLEAVRRVSGQPLLQAGDLRKHDVSGLQVLGRKGLSHKDHLMAGDAHEYDVLTARNWNLTGSDPADYPLSDVVPSIAESVSFELSRSSSEWSKYDGNVDVSDRYTNESEDSTTDSAVGSATAFETYAGCPYRYFLSRRLHVEPTESPEPEMALDPLTFGTLIHEVLEKFALWRMKFDPPGDQPERSEQEVWLKGAVDTEIEKLKDETPGWSEGAWQIEQSRAWLILRQWLRREPDIADSQKMRQVEAEYSFGSDDKNPAVEVRTASGKLVRFRGQIDRVDISEDGKRVIVYDYKSGSNISYTKLDSDPIKRGTKLQLPLYSKAVAKKYPGTDISAAYWFVRETGTSELRPAPAKYDQIQADKALNAAVETIVEGIDNGVFPARPGDSASWGGGAPSYENCLYCEFAQVCPKSKVRLWEAKKKTDPALSSYLELSEPGDSDQGITS